LVEVDADEYWFCKVNKKCDWDDENFVQKNYNWKKVREEVMDHCKDKNAVICF